MIMVMLIYMISMIHSIEIQEHFAQLNDKNALATCVKHEYRKKNTK